MIPILRRSVLPMQQTISLAVPASARSPIWSTPTGPMSGCMAQLPTKSGLVDQELSKQLKAIYAGYQTSLNLQGKNGFGTITAENYDKYLLQYYLIPSANKYLRSLTDEKRKEYLESNKWITWTDKGAAFEFADYVTHVGRMKGLPAFDDFDMRQPEPDFIRKHEHPCKAFYKLQPAAFFQ